MSKLAFVASILAVGLLAAPPARANVNKVDVFAGRLTMPSACFVQVDLKAVESNLFNGNEKITIGGTDWASFSSLSGTRTNLSPGQSVLFGSEKFKSESGLAPDITVTDADCEKIVGGITLSFLGSFGPEAGKVDVPEEFGALKVVGQLLLIDLQLQEFRAKSLTGEKTLGTAGGSGGTPGSSGSPGSSGTPGSSGSTTTSGGTQPSTPSGSDDSCAVHGAPGTNAATGVPMAATLAGLVAILGRRRRRR